MQVICTFFISSILLLSLILGHSYSVDSFDFWGSGTGIQPINNPHIGKLELIQENEFDCIIVGSSRGETFSPFLATQLTASNCVSASVGGATTSLKLAYIESLIEKKTVTNIFYISDFYEFFDGPYPDEVIFHSKLFSLVSTFDPQIKAPSLLDHFLKLIDHVSIERDIAASRLVNQSNFVSNLDARGGKRSLQLAEFNTPIKPNFSSFELLRRVNADFDSYSKTVWLGDFNSNRQSMLIDRLKKYKQDGAAINILLTPFHPKFKSRFLSERSDLLASYHKWQLSFVELEKAGFNVCDFSSIELDSSTSTWDDGVHLNRDAASGLLRNCLRGDK